MKKKYDVAAYVWPAYTGDEPRARMFWSEGYGEWQTVKNAEANALAYKPEWYETWKKRKPLWGYVNEANPDVMQMQIECAVNHGVNVFIYDWYWYDNRPFLENCLNDGFLKANNNDKMKFYIMWANHDADHTWDIRLSDERPGVIWRGTVDRKQFEIIGRRWIDRYFTKENYYRIDGKPVISIYYLRNFIVGLGGVKQAADALDWLRKEAIKAGFPGVHLQLVRMPKHVNRLSDFYTDEMKNDVELIEKMGFDSMTHYTYRNCTNVDDRDYSDIIPDVVSEWNELDKEYHIPYYPHVCIGLDVNPRYKKFCQGAIKNDTPQNFELALRHAKDYVDTHEQHAPLIVVNSWNEWTETSYLEPDALNGYGYLEAVKKVFVDET